MADVDLSALGYEGLAEVARLASQANVSLDFIDHDHVLVTFNPKRLFQRLPSCPPTHQDRLVHAAVVQLPGGKVVREADWYLHDSKRYLWKLDSGRFLLRKLNTLYIVDSNLRETQLMSSAKDFLWITVTPDGKQIITETDDDSASKNSKPESGKPRQRVKIEFVDVASQTVQRTIKSDSIVTLEGTSTGFADVSHNLTGKVWLVRFGPNSRQRDNIARVRSRCIPDVFYSSANTLLIGRCSASGPDYSVTSFTVTGHRLWSQRWNEPRYVPRIAHSDDGSRFAVSTLQRTQASSAPASNSDEDDEGDVNHGLQQGIQVFNTANGAPVLSVNVSPVVLSAQNFSLSPEGDRLAVLKDSMLRVYELPPLSEADRASTNALKADVPGLYMPASDKQLQLASNSDEDPGYAAAEAAPADSPSAAEEKKPEDKIAAAANAEAPSPPQPTRSGVPPSGDDSSITFKVSSQIVVVDVVVTDRSGKPVSGIAPSEFHVAEDGKDQRIANFEESGEGGGHSVAPGLVPEASAPQSAGESPKLPSNIFTNNSTAAETRTVTLILLDLLNTPVPDQHYAREELIKYLKSKPIDQPVALCTLSSNLRLIQGFTQEENQLIAAINGKKGGVKANPWQSDTGLTREVQFQRDLSLLDSSAQFTMQLLQEQQDEQAAHNIDVRMRYTLDAFAQLARYLSGIPGRKNVIWISGSFPISIAPNPSFSQLQGVVRNYTADIKNTSNLLAQSHVAVYPVSAKGSVTQTMYSAANNGEYVPPQVAGSLTPISAGAGNPALANTSTSLPMPSRMQDETRQFRETQAAELAAMDQVAADTGGKAFYGTNKLDEAIESAVDQGSHYYTLSYSPSNKRYDGGFRKIKISIERKGYHLAYRQGYYAIDPNAPLKETNDPSRKVGLAAMQQGSPQSHQIIFAARVVRLGKPKKVDTPLATPSAAKEKKKNGQHGPTEMQHYSIDYAVNPADLLFTSTDTGLHRSVLNFMITAFNDDGRLVASLASTATSDLKPANYKAVMTGGFRLHQELDVPVDAVSIRLGVEDETSNHIGTMEIPLPVPALPEVPRTEAHALPPIEPD